LQLLDILAVLRDVVFDLFGRHREAKARKHKEKQQKFFKHFLPLNLKELANEFYQNSLANQL
jgi:hypothetical protein